MPRLSEIRAQAAPAPAEAPQRLRLSEVRAQSQAPQPSLFRADSDFLRRSGLVPDEEPSLSAILRNPRQVAGASLSMLGAAGIDMFGSREAAANFLAERTGGTVEADESGEPILRLPSGRAYRLNDPGLDSTDVANFTGNVAAYLNPARAAAGFAQGAQLGRAGTIGAQGLAAGATDLAIQGAVAGATDLAQEGEGYQVSPLRVGVSAAGGAGGEALAPVIGAAFRRGAELLGRGAGARNEAAAQITRELGLERPTPQQVRLIERAATDIARGADPEAVLGGPEFGFIYTQGMRMPARTPAEQAARFRQLSIEDTLRSDPVAGAPLREVQDANQNALRRGIEQISARYGAQPAAAPVEGVERVQDVLQRQASGLRERVREAYEAVPGGTFVRVDALRQLPQRLNRAVADFGIEEGLHPQSFSALRTIQTRLANLPEGARAVSLDAIERTRRTLNKRRQDAVAPSDQEAMRRIIGEFDTFVDDAMTNALERGDATALEFNKRARGFRREFAQRFEGEESTDNFVRGLIDDVRVEAKTPEQLLNMALGAGQVSQPGAANFIRRLRVASNDDPTVINGMRTAHFLRMVRGPNGEALDPARVMNNIRATERNNRSLVRALYTDEEWAAVRRLAQAIEPTIPDAASEQILRRTSGTTERLLRSVGNFPFLRQAVEAVARPVNVYRASSAVNAPVPRPAPRTAIPSATGAAGGAEIGNELNRR